LASRVGIVVWLSRPLSPASSLAPTTTSAWASYRRRISMSSDHIAVSALVKTDRRRWALKIWYEHFPGIYMSFYFSFCTNSNCTIVFKMVNNYFCLRPKAKDLGITRVVVVLGFMFDLCLIYFHHRATPNFLNFYIF